MSASDTFFNNLTPVELEAVTLASEESGECVQAAGKITRHGLESSNPFEVNGPTNREQLAIELADILAAIDVLHLVGVIDKTTLAALKRRKLTKLPKYLHHIDISPLLREHEEGEL